MANVNKRKTKEEDIEEALDNLDENLEETLKDLEEDKDEFYTMLPDIENELEHYKGHFENACVYCNCDDPLESNFFIYFVKHFKELGLRRLITTCYDGSPVAGTQLLLPFAETKKDPKRVAHKIVIDNVGKFSSADGKITFRDVEKALLNGAGQARLEKLNGNGDFRSEECVKILEEKDKEKKVDIVVTNPPFSLFREYVAQLMKYEKKFLILGNQFAISYNEIFPLLKANKIWQGWNSGDMEFAVPKYYKERKNRYRVDENGQKWRSMGNICWFTNLEHNKRAELFPLKGKYTSKEYPKYDNYDAIEVSKSKNIPSDYDGAMGVPITFLDKYNPDQFEILGLGNGREHFTPTKDYINPIHHSVKTGKTKKGGEINRVLAVKTKTPPKGKKSYYTSDNVDGYLYAPFARIIIRRKSNK